MANPENPATVECRPLADEDRQMADLANDRLRGMQTLAVVLGVGFFLGGWYMGQRGHTGDAVAGVVAGALMWLCVLGLGRARARNAKLGTKDVITGAIRRRKRFETEYSVLHHFDVGGIEVAVPASVFDRFQEGQVVRVERLTGSRQFLSIEPVADSNSGAAWKSCSDPAVVERTTAPD